MVGLTNVDMYFKAVCYQNFTRLSLTASDGKGKAVCSVLGFCVVRLENHCT